MNSTLPLGARKEIEAVILEHPEVSRVSILDQEGPAGEHYSIVYATASADTSAPVQLSSSRQERRIGQWKTIFNMTYRPQRDDKSPSFVGWHSSYTNKEIPPEEMREWVDCTLERIRSHAPERILEIGCGVGLLTQRLAPERRAYTGTDLSSAAIKRLREFAAARPDLSHVELLEREATNFDGLSPESFDMAVINSVVQYFPDLGYLETVLSRAADVVASGGHIFVGDVRHLGLLPTFHASVQLAKAPSTAKAGWLRSKASLMVEQERELVIDPEFFTSLGNSIPRIRHVDILLKRGRAHNEMTAYRYDVVLHVGDGPTAALQEPAVWRGDAIDVDEVVSRFEEQRLDAVRILDVPNLRVWRDVAAARLLDSADDQTTAGDIRHEIDSLDEKGGDPEAFWRLADQRGYDVRVEWTARSQDGRFDVVLSRRGFGIGRPSARKPATGAPGEADRAQGHRPARRSLQAATRKQPFDNSAGTSAGDQTTRRGPHRRSHAEISRRHFASAMSGPFPSAGAERPAGSGKHGKTSVIGESATQRRSEIPVDSESSPAAPALFCEGQVLDFAQLNSLANRCARWLLDRGIRARTDRGAATA